MHCLQYIKPQVRSDRDIELSRSLWCLLSCDQSICTADSNPLTWAVFKLLSCKHRLSGHVTSSVTRPSISYGRFPIDASLVLTLSPKDFEVLRLKCIRVSVLTFLDHVTSLNTLSLPRDASAERGNAIVSRPSVCLSVCLSVCDV